MTLQPPQPGCPAGGPGVTALVIGDLSPSSFVTLTARSNPSQRLRQVAEYQSAAGPAHSTELDQCERALPTPQFLFGCGPITNTSVEPLAMSL